jgi:ribonuclease P protein component
VRWRYHSTNVVSRTVRRSIKEQIPNLEGYRIVVMTSHQTEALDYALFHMSDVVEGLFKAYYGTTDSEA